MVSDMAIAERLLVVEKELAKATRWNWRLTGVGIVLGLVGAIWLTMESVETAQAQAYGKHPRVIRASSFEVVDDDGDKHAVFQMTEAGPALFMSNGKARTGISLLMVENRPALMMEDETGRTRVTLTGGAEGPMLYMFGDKGEKRIVLSAFNRIPRLHLFDEQGRERATMGVSRSGPGLSMYDEKDKPIWMAP